jgi:hypothetical protein
LQIAKALVEKAHMAATARRFWESHFAIQKKIAIILGVIVLAIAIGFVASSQFIGSFGAPEQAVETPEERASRLGLGADVNADEAGTTTDLAPVEARPLTGNEGELVDGVRELAPAEPARMEDRDYFDGLEDMEAAKPVADKPVEPKPEDVAAPPEKPAEPVVERPDDSLLDELDNLE